MALKVKAQEKLQKIGTHAGKYRYIMMPELYTSLSQEKVIKRKAFLGTDSWTSQAAARPLVAFMRCLHALRLVDMTKEEGGISAILTALGATSCMGM